MHVHGQKKGGEYDKHEQYRKRMPEHNAGAATVSGPVSLLMTLPRMFGRHKLLIRGATYLEHGGAHTYVCP